MRSQLVNDDTHQLFKSDVEAEILSMPMSGPDTKWRKIQEADVLARQICEINENDHRVYFISKSFSWGHLRITADAFNKLLESEDVFDHYNELVRAFASRIRDTNNAHLILYITRFPAPAYLPSTYYEVCYNVYHLEKNHRQRGDPWSLRETGVYHKLNISTRRSTWIFIQISQAARRVIEQTQGNDEVRLDVLYTNCLRLHILLLCSMATNWSEYIDYLGSIVDELDEKFSYSNVEDHDEVDYPVTFTDSQFLHVLQTKLRKARRALECCQNLAQGLEDSWLAVKDNMSSSQDYITDIVSPGDLLSLRIYLARLTSHHKGIETILQRSHSIESLLSKILESRNTEKMYQTSRAIEKSITTLEYISTKSNKTSQSLADMAREANHDSITLKVLTLIATIYLPASLSATIFSLNLIQMVSEGSISSQGSHFVLAKDFWMFIVVTLGFMIFTLTIFLLLQKLRSKKRRLASR